MTITIAELSANTPFSTEHLNTALETATGAPELVERIDIAVANFAAAGGHSEHVLRDMIESLYDGIFHCGISGTWRIGDSYPTWILTVDGMALGAIPANALRQLIIETLEYNFGGSADKV